MKKNSRTEWSTFLKSVSLGFLQGTEGLRQCSEERNSLTHVLHFGEYHGINISKSVVSHLKGVFVGAECVRLLYVRVLLLWGNISLFNC